MRFMDVLRFNLMLVAALGLLAGCGDSGTADSGGKEAMLPAAFVLADSPGEATPVTALRASASEGDEVVMRVVIGGRENPFVSERAIMTVVDAGIPNACMNEGEGCATPWDYCCDDPDHLTKNMATVRLVDESGAPMAINLAGTLLEPNTVLHVRGKVGAGSNADNLVVNAEGLWVEKVLKKSGGE